MHAEAYEAMRQLLGRGPGRGARVLDVGSYDVNGTYRPLVEGRGWEYTGLDVAAGPNVDVVTADAYRFPFEDGAFDVVLTGSTMEHVEAIWRWVPELARVLKPGGLLAIVTHWSFPEHRYRWTAGGLCRMGCAICSTRRAAWTSTTSTSPASGTSQQAR